MFTFDQLTWPLVGAPMAGGPSSPELVAAVSNRGGLGMLGAGYYNLEQLEHDVASTRALLDDEGCPFGVNLFVPHSSQGDQVEKDLEAYRQQLRPLGEELGIDVDSIEVQVPQNFDALLNWLLTHPVPVVTFTFGLPPEGIIEKLQAVGTAVGITVTKVDAALASAQAGANFLTVQGPLAGGHQSTFTIEEEPNEQPLPQLLVSIQEVTDLPLVAGGGVRSETDIHKILGLGVEAVQVGTMLLLWKEAGTDPVYRQALESGLYSHSRMTRCFTGRPARALVNSFVTAYHDLAPAVYPQVHYLTAPLRAEAKKQNRYDLINLWSSGQ